MLLGAIALAIAAGQWSLFALRRPRRVGRAALVALGTFLLVAAIGALLSQLSLNPAKGKVLAAGRVASAGHDGLRDQRRGRRARRTVRRG